MPWPANLCDGEAAYVAARRYKVSLMRSATKSLAVLLAASLALMPAAALGAEAIHFEKESLFAYEGQLHHKEVHALAFHPGTTTGHLHISLNDGKHMTVEYAVANQGKLVAQAQAAGTRVQVAKATAKKTAPVKHRLRYIAAGILVVVILVVLAVLLIGRRRTLAEEGSEASGESGAS